MKLAWVCPISGGGAHTALSGGFLVTVVGTGLRTDGSIHTHQITGLDWQAGRASMVERVPVSVVTQVLDGLWAMLDD